MKKHHAPLLLPSAALAFGAWAAFHLPHLSVPLLGALAVLGLILGLVLRRPAGTALAFVALGLLVAVLRQGLPDRPETGLNRDLPVEAVVRVDGHWNPDGTAGDSEGWAAPARVLRLRQGERQLEPSLDVFLFLPGIEDPPAVGSTLRLRGYLARSAGFANRGATPPGPWRMRIKSRLLIAVEAPPGRLDRLSGALRLRVEAAYRASGPESGGGRQGKTLARAMVLGDASDLPLEWKRALRVTGLYHLMSVSGVHVALVAAAIWTLGGWLPRSVRLLLMLAGMGLYLLLVGPLPPLVRAAVMGGLAVLALLAQRPPAAVNALGWAVVLLVVHRPDLVNQPSFQLTVAATAGILLVGPRLAERWSAGAVPHWLATSLAVSVAAQLATIPWILPRFHLLSPASPLLNLIAVPWTGLVLGASLLWTGLALISPPLAAWFLPVLDILAAPFAWPCHVPPEVWGTVPLRLPAWGAWALAIWLGSLLLMRSSRLWVRRTRTCAVILTLAALAASGWLGWPGRNPGPELAMLDVGQGDAILLRDGNRAVLVDGGGWDGGDLGGRVLLPALLAEGISSLDALVMTHPDRDHCGGLIDIAAYLPVREVWMGHGWDPKSCAGRLVTLPGVRPRLLAAGDQESLGGWRLKVLHPESDERRGENERSLVLLAETAGKRVLLTGDVESWAEQRLLSCCAPDLRVDVLKVAHHGSRTSTGESFLEESRPRLALISAGRNNVYRHPSAEVLERLERYGVRALRTDRDGQISVSWNEEGRIRIELPGVPR
jgi:competence protein ComEC